MQPSEFKELLVSHGKVSRSLSAADLVEAQRLVEAWKNYQRQKVATMLVENACMPILWQHSLDTTPVRLRKSLQSRSGSLKYQGSGKATTDLLVQQVFLSTLNAQGQRVHQILFKQALELEHGKTALALTACALQCPGMGVRPADPSSIMISHQVGDRGIPKQTRHAINGHRVKSLHAGSTFVAGEGIPDAVTHWGTSVGCAAHDFHNSLKWAHQVVFDHPKIVLTNLYVAISTFKAAQVKATAVLGSWLNSVIMTKKASLCPGPSELQCLYAILGVDADLQKLLIDSQVHWDPALEKLCVSEVYMDAAADWSADLSTMMLLACSFVAFTTSRWLTLGSSCRQWLLAALVGFPHLFEYMKFSGTLSAWNAAGGEKMGPPEKQFCAVVGLCAHVSESCLAIALEDCRLAMHSTLLQISLLEELEKLQTAPMSVWNALGPLVGLSAEALRDKTLWGASVSATYIQHRVLNVLFDYPWSLGNGNIDANLTALRELAVVPDDPVAAKIQSLLKGGFPRVTVHQAVELLCCASFTSTFTEKQHASCALVRKQHPEMTSKNLATRGFLHTCRMLLPGVLSPEERHIARLRSQIGRLRQKQPQRITGRQVYFSEMAAKARHNNEERRRTGKKPLSYRMVMGLHAQYWATLSEEKKGHYDRLALTMQAQRQAEQFHQQQRLQAEAADQEATLKNKKAYACDSMTISHCRLREPELTEFCAMWNEARFLPKAKVQRLREESAQCPRALSEPEMQTLLKMSALEDDPVASSTPTYKAVARHRTFFAQTVFGVPDELGENRWYRFSFATLQPIRAFFLPLELAIAPASASSGLKGDWGHDLRSSWIGHWSISDMFGSDSDIFALAPSLDDVVVFLESTFLGDSTLGSLDTPRPLNLFLRELETLEMGVTHGNTRKRLAPEDDEIVTAAPAWLHANIAQPSSSSAASASKKDSACLRDTVATDEPSGSDADEDYENLLRALEADKEHEALIRQEEDWSTDFYVHLLGGKWQMQRVGRMKYGLRYDIRPTSPLFQFADKFSLPKSASFDDSVYGEALGHLLGNIWMQRHRQLYEHWLDKESPDVFPITSMPSLTLTSAQEQGIQDLEGTRRRRTLFYVELKPGDARR